MPAPAIGALLAAIARTGATRFAGSMAARGAAGGVTRAGIKAAAKDAGKEALKEGAIHGLAMALAALRKKVAGQPTQQQQPAQAPPQSGPEQPQREQSQSQEARVAEKLLKSFGYTFRSSRRESGSQQQGSWFNAIEGKAPDNAREITKMLREGAARRGFTRSGAGSQYQPRTKQPSPPPPSPGEPAGAGGQQPPDGPSNPPPSGPSGNQPNRNRPGWRNAAAIGGGLLAALGLSKFLPRHLRDPVKSEREKIKERMTEGRNRVFHGLRMAFDPAYRKRQREEQWEKVKGGSVSLIKSLATLTASLITGGKAAEAFGRRVLEGQRDLRRFNAGIANAFARIDRQDMVLAGRKASATSGSTQLLAKQYMELRNDLSPITHGIASSINLIATGVVGIARIATLLVKLNPALKFGLWTLEQIERKLDPAGDGAKRSAYQGFLRDIVAGKWGAPKNQPPKKGK